MKELDSNCVAQKNEPEFPSIFRSSSSERDAQVAYFREHGFLRIRGVFDGEQLQELRTDLNWMMDSWARRDAGWSGPWRRALMSKDVEASSELVAMHDLQFYSAAWMSAMQEPRLISLLSKLFVDEGVSASSQECSEVTPVELHHSTMHVKPPETGHPFPMHQDYAFFPHDDTRFVCALVHLDDTNANNGEIRFLDGSHKHGPLEHHTHHVNERGQVQPCSPHLPLDRYKLSDTVAVPAQAGDVVCFHIHAVHGSYVNQTRDYRRMVRVGYRHPDNQQLGGQSHGRPGLVVQGRRSRLSDQALFHTA